MSGTCVHKRAVISETESRERLWAFIHGNNEESVSSATVDEWEAVIVRSCSRDSCSVSQIFRPELLIKQWGSSVTALFDERPSRTRLGYTLRVRCINCCGDASTRPMCSHELKYIQMIKERDSVKENRM